MTPKNYLYEMIRSRLAIRWSAMSIKLTRPIISASIATIGCQCWHDRGERPTPPDLDVYRQHAGGRRDSQDRQHPKIPVTPWGGSGSQGGALPVYGGIVLDMKRMNKVIEIDPVTMCVTAGQASTRWHLEWEVEGRFQHHASASIPVPHSVVSSHTAVPCSAPVRQDEHDHVAGGGHTDRRNHQHPAGTASRLRPPSPNSF